MLYSSAPRLRTFPTYCTFEASSTSKRNIAEENGRLYAPESVVYWSMKWLRNMTSQVQLLAETNKDWVDGRQQITHGIVEVPTGWPKYHSIKKKGLSSHKKINKRKTLDSLRETRLDDFISYHPCHPKRRQRKEAQTAPQIRICETKK